MERTARITRYVLCAALATVAFVSSTTAAAGAVKKAHRGRRVTCVVHMKRHGKKPGRKVRRVVRCNTRRAKRRAKIALKGHGFPSKKSAPTPTGPGSASAVTGRLDVGLNTSVAGWTDESSRMNEIVSQSGTHWIREAFDWSQIEPRRGSYDFSRYDLLMTVAAQRNVRVLADLLDTPSWAGANWNTIPSDPSAFAEFVAAVVKRYGLHGTFWADHPNLQNDAVSTFELWNEPYYDNGNDGAYNPGRYARLVKAAGNAGHGADPAAKFLLAADNQSQLVGSTWVWWVDALYQAVPDLNRYFDGVAVHPYGTDLTGVQYPAPGKAYDGYGQVRRLESIRQEFVNHGGSGKPLWITEIGWPTCTNGGSDRCTTSSGQAHDIQTVFDRARSTWKSYVQAVFFYGYQDNNTNTADPENDYGLVYHDGSPKPALSVFRANL
ncbi:MAG: beta-galactosidase [Solirubrobacteraceae bacterium]